MSSVGYATIQIIPVLRGMDSSISRQLNGRMGSIGNAAGSAVGAGLLSRMSSQVIGGLDALGARITSKLKVATAVGLGGLAGLAGFSLVGGLGRLLDTEDATVQMRRMGLSIEQVDKILQGVNDTFEGTPFANPDGFKITSQLYASGVAFDDITGILGNIADLAAHGNVPLEQMGGVFTRIAAQGRVMGDEFNQLATAGVPLTVMADALGVSVEEMLKMGSEGKITSEIFFDMIDSIEMFQGAAQAAGDTTRGAFSNVRTAMKRLGEQFLKPLFGENGPMVTFLKALKDAMSGLSLQVGVLGQQFADWLLPQMERLQTWLANGGLSDALASITEKIRGVFDWFDRNRDTISKIAAAILPVGGALAGLATSVHLLGIAFKALTMGHPVLALITLIATGLVYAWQNSEKFREVVTGAFTAVQNAIGPIVTKIGGWLSNLFGGGGGSAAANGAMSKLTAAWQRVREVAADVWPKVQKTLGTFFGHIAKTYGPVVSDFVDMLRAGFERAKAIVSAVVEVFQDVWAKHADRIKGILGDYWAYIQRTFSRIAEILSNVFNGIKALFQGDWASLWHYFVEVVKGVGSQIADMAKTLGTILLKALPVVWDVIKGLLGKLWEGLGPQITKGLNNLGGLIQTGLSAAAGFFKDLPGNALSALGALGGWLVDKGAELLNGLWDGISGVWDDTIVPWFEDLPGLALDALGALGGWLVDKGKELIGGLADGIVFVAEVVWRWFKDLGATVVDKVGELGETLWNKGYQIISGFADGIGNRVILLFNWFTSLPGLIAGKVGELGETLKQKGKDLIGGFVSGINSFAGSIGSSVVSGLTSFANTLIDKVNWVVDRLDFLLGPFINFDRIPHIGQIGRGVFFSSAGGAGNAMQAFHSGGIVQGPAGSEQLALLKAGELVLTRQQQYELGAHMAAAASTRSTGASDYAFNIEHLEVGSRQDLPSVKDELSRIAFRARYGVAS